MLWQYHGPECPSNSSHAAKLRHLNTYHGLGGVPWRQCSLESFPGPSLSRKWWHPGCILWQYHCPKFLRNPSNPVELQQLNKIWGLGGMQLLELIPHLLLLGLPGELVRADKHLAISGLQVVRTMQGVSVRVG